MKRLITLAIVAASLASCSFRQETTIITRMPNAAAWIESRTEENFMDGWREYTVWGVNQTASPVCMVVRQEGRSSADSYIVPANTTLKLFRRGSSGTEYLQGAQLGVGPVLPNGSCPALPPRN
ncbi:hypothetical protein [Brevundimonas sp.]|uniref:hypothetical protein n=1 Tax=Brevundimonas sp. TaxID=1871086 RepID=UPI002ABC61A4|nr:hypothetical protein [Brevundimonas sp.]MDZ4364362.1 hypothetical protein [Brevundimonas sp.]